MSSKLISVRRCPIYGMGKPVPTYNEYILAVQSALREPPGEAKTLLDALEAKRVKLSEVEPNITANPQKSNVKRIEFMTARSELLLALSKN